MKTTLKTFFKRCFIAVLLANTLSAKALIITPTFDSSITSDPNAATIESVINTAIQFYEARFSDPITVTILFQEISTAGLYGHSSWWYYSISYSQYRSSLAADATTTNDTIALAHLPTGSANPVTTTLNVRVKTSNLRAIGIFGDNSGLTGGVDGIIGLHVSSLNLTRPDTDSSKGDLLATIEHEIDEVLGLASALDSSSGDPLPEDLFRYTAEGARTYITSGDDAYFSLDGVNFLARFNQNSGGDFGDWWTAGAHTPQVQDAFASNGAMPNPKAELIALDVIGYNLLPPPVPRITRTSVSGTQLTLTGTNGLAGGTYVVLTSTTASTPLSQWTPIATNYQTTDGNFTFTVPNSASRTETKRFFALELQ